MDQVQFTCPECEGWLVAPAVYRGREINCRHCEAPVRVPMEAQVVAGAAEAPEGWQGIATFAGIIVVGVAITLFFTVTFGGDDPEAEPMTAAEIEESRVAEQGSRIEEAVRRWARDGFADPDAEVIDVQVSPELDPDEAVNEVVVRVRGTNALGGKTVGTYRLEVEWWDRKVVKAERVK